MGNGSRLVSSLVSSCVDTQAKTALTSSLVAAYWRVEAEVDRPVAGSTFMLVVITMATVGKMDGADCITNVAHVYTHTQNKVLHVKQSVPGLTVLHSYIRFS